MVLPSAFEGVKAGCTPAARSTSPVPAPTTATRTCAHRNDPITLRRERCGHPRGLRAPTCPQDVTCLRPAGLVPRLEEDRGGLG